MKAKIWFISLLASLGLGLYALVLLLDAGTFQRVVNHHLPYHCSVVGDAPGIEDLEFLPGTNLVVGTSHQRVPLHSNFSGGLVTFDYSKSGNRASSASNHNQPVGHIVDTFAYFSGESLGIDEFAPHGLGVLPIENATAAPSTSEIFVVNHRKAHDTIEVVEFSSAGFSHLRTIKLPSIETANGILPISQNEFYITTDFGSRSHLAQSLEKYLRMARGKVFHWKNGNLKEVANGLFFGNGMAQNKKDGHIFVAEMLARLVREYQIEPETGSLTQVTTYNIGAAPDNIKLNERNELLIGAHPKLLSLNAHSKNPTEKYSPSQILRLPIRNGANESLAAISEVFSDTGLQFPAISTALEAPDGTLLMGMIYHNGIVVCPKEK